MSQNIGQAKRINLKTDYGYKTTGVKPGSHVLFKKLVYHHCSFPGVYI